MASPKLKFWVNIHTYNTYGGHNTVSLVGKYFQFGLPPLGDGIGELDIHVYFRSTTGPKATLESIYDRYALFIEGLPTSKFYRKKARFEINFLSELGGSEIVAGYGPPRLDLFVASAREIASKLEVLRTKMKPSDIFKTEDFFDLIQKKLEALPSSENELQLLKTSLDAEGKREREAMDEWEKLGIDWDDYHPTSRLVLNDPFFWNCTDDFSPNGNDTGADVLGIYSESKAKRSGVAFLERLMRDWGMSSTPSESDDIGITTLEEARVGLAFAQLKVDGVCEADVKKLALQALEGCRARMKRDHAAWNLLEERLRTLELMEKKLSSILPE